MEKRLFKPRFTAPSKTDKHYYSKENPLFEIEPMPNCTTYAWGRFYELAGNRYEKLKGNGKDFYWTGTSLCGLEGGKEPRLGALIVWDELNGYGHVGVVEEIKPNGDIIVSNSAWKGEEFYLRTVTKASGYTYTYNKPFKGFVYPPYDFYVEQAEPDVEKIYYRVQVGSYLIKSNAVRQAQKIKAMGYPVIIKKFGLYHRVQVGAYEQRKNAENMRDKMRGLGFKGAYITTEGGSDVAF